MRYSDFVFVFFPPVVSRGPSFSFDRAAEAEKTEAAREGNGEICAVRLESSALSANTGLDQITREQETKPGQRTAADFLLSVIFFR